MNNKKATKRALLTSITALVMCVVMLAGTTFAWFTDTATTSVNKIQAGTLKVGLQMKNANDEWVDAEGTTLNFKKASTASGTEVLWEPGCTYSLPALKIKNEGSLALKYRVLFSAANPNKADLELAKVLDVTMNGSPAGTLYDVLTSTDADGYARGNLAGNAETDPITLSVKMRESAGNDYQDKTIDGIAITVVATQDTVEYDSTGHEYDKDAPTVEVSTELELRTALHNNPYAKIVLQNDITLSMQYDSSNNGSGNKLDDSAAGDTLSNYYGAEHFGDNRAARLVVKKGRYIILDLNGHTIARGSGATHGSWSRTDTDLIANFGILTVTDSSTGAAGTLKGSGFVSCGGAVLHNYGANAVLTVEKVTVFGNAAGQTAGTGQNTIINGDAGSENESEEWTAQRYAGGTVIIDGAKVYDEGIAINTCLVKNVSGTMTIKGNASLSSTKALCCDGGTVYVESATITGSTDTSKGYAIKAAKENSAAKAEVVVVSSGVTITGCEKTDKGGTITHK